MKSKRTARELRALIQLLEVSSEEKVHEILRNETNDELCALNGLAGRRTSDLIQRELRNTDDL